MTGHKSVRWIVRMGQSVMSGGPSKIHLMGENGSGGGRTLCGIAVGRQRGLMWGTWTPDCVACQKRMGRNITMGKMVLTESPGQITREKIETEVARFLAGGGRIEKVTLKPREGLGLVERRHRVNPGANHNEETWR